MATRYIVHGTDQNGNAVRKVIEAESAAAAAQVAGNIGVTVRGVEVDAPASPVGVASGTPGGPETPVWTDVPSQWPNAGWFAMGLLIIPLPYSIFMYLKTRTTRFTLTTERLRLESGILNKNTEEIELYRVKDTELFRGFWQRIFGLGTIAMVTSDPTTPRLELRNIKDASGVREKIRQNVERVRKTRGVRELDVADNVFS